MYVQLKLKHLNFVLVPVACVEILTTRSVPHLGSLGRGERRPTACGHRLIQNVPWILLGARCPSHRERDYGSIADRTAHTQLEADTWNKRTGSLEMPGVFPSGAISKPYCSLTAYRSGYCRPASLACASFTYIAHSHSHRCPHILFTQHCSKYCCGQWNQYRTEECELAGRETTDASIKPPFQCLVVQSEHCCRERGHARANKQDADGTTSS